MVELFKLEKIDDSVIPEIEDTKLVSLGMVYGDIISLRSSFPKNLDTRSRSTLQSHFRDKANALKEKLKMTRSDKKDSKNRPICVKNFYDLQVQLKCKENSKYVAKRGFICNQTVSKSTTYDEIHQNARNFFRIKHSDTVLANFMNQKLEMKSFADFLLLQKEKKRTLSMYLLYPYPFILLEQEQE